MAKQHQIQMVEQVIDMVQQNEESWAFSQSNLPPISLSNLNVNPPPSFAPQYDQKMKLKKDSMISLNLLADAGKRDTLNRSMMLPSQTDLEAAENFELEHNIEKFNSFESDIGSEKHTLKDVSRNVLGIARTSIK